MSRIVRSEAGARAGAGGTHLSRRGLVLGATALGGLAIIGAQRIAAQSTGSPAAAGNFPRLDVTVRDFAIDLPATIAGGLVEVVMVNEGPQPHHVMFMRLHDPATADAFLAAAAVADEAAIFTLAAGVGGPGGVIPGATSTVVLDLPEGEYFVICAIPSPDERAHYMDGMIVPLTVTAPTATLAPPAADQVVSLIDFAFMDLPIEVPAGHQIWEVTNNGVEPHELVLAQLAPGVAFNDVLAFFGLGAPAASPETGHTDHAMGTPAPLPAEELLQVPIIPLAGVAPYSPGFTNYMVADLAAGDYVLMCFIGSPTAGGAPHFVLGMVMPLTVI